MRAMGAQWEKRKKERKGKKKNNKFNIRDIPKPFFQRGHALFSERIQRAFVRLFQFSIRSIRISNAKYHVLLKRYAINSCILFIKFIILLIKKK